jgi:hypothetical protein
MINKNYDITKIEGVLWNLCKTTLGSSMKVYAGNRPASVETSLTSFCVVAVPGNITDLDAFGRGYVTIYIYAKDLTGGIKNGAILSQLHDLLIAALPYSDADYFIDFSSEASFNDSSGFHIQAINMILKTKRIL